MNPKSRRILATVGFVFMSLFVISFITYLFDSGLFGGRIGWIAMAFLMVGLVIFAIIYFTHGFPFQQIRDAELKRQREEYLMRQADKEQKEADAAEQAKAAEQAEGTEKTEGDSADNNGDTDNS